MCKPDFSSGGAGDYVITSLTSGKSGGRVAIGSHTVGTVLGLWLENSVGVATPIRILIDRR